MNTKLEQLRLGYEASVNAPFHDRQPSLFNLRAPERYSALCNWIDLHPEMRVLPEEVRDVNRERERIHIYLEREFENLPGYREYLESLANLPTVCPMEDECRLSVNMPAHNEGMVIYRTLELYTQQVDSEGKQIDGNTWEIIILVNNKFGDEFDDTESEILRFLNDNNGRIGLPKINYIKQSFNSPFNNTGNARKILTDLTLLRSLKRRNQILPLYIETEDADLESVDKNLVHNAVTELDRNPRLDYVLGITDRSPWILMRNDYVFFKTRLNDFVATLLRNRKYRNPKDPNYSFSWNRIITNGWLCTYTAEAYAISGGYDPFAFLGQDLPIGEALSIFRSTDKQPNLELGKTVPTRGNSSPRRIIYSIATRLGQYNVQVQDGDALKNQMKNASIDFLLVQIEHLSHINSSNIELFEECLMEKLKRVRNEVPVSEYKNFVNRLFMFLGFKKDDYEIIDDNLPVIYDWSNVANCLEKYRDKNKIT